MNLPEEIKNIIDKELRGLYYRRDTYLKEIENTEKLLTETLEEINKLLVYLGTSTEEVEEEPIKKELLEEEPKKRKVKNMKWTKYLVNPRRGEDGNLRADGAKYSGSEPYPSVQTLEAVTKWGTDGKLYRADGRYEGKPIGKKSDNMRVPTTEINKRTYPTWELVWLRKYGYIAEEIRFEDKDPDNTSIYNMTAVSSAYHRLGKNIYISDEMH